MGSLVMHICASNIVKEDLRLSNKYLAGCVLPDLIKLSGIDSNIAHYTKLVADENGNVKSLPNLEGFIEDNTFKLLDFVTLGYYSHLIEDRIWFDKYVGKYVKWHDEDLELVTNLKTGKVYEFDRYKEEIYSDYSNANKRIIEKYNLDMDKIINEVTDSLPDKSLARFLNVEQGLKNNNKRFFLTDEDVDCYINDCVNEVEKRLKELR